MESRDARIIRSIKRLEIHCVRERTAEYRRTIVGSGDAVRLATSLLGKFDHERMLVLLFDTGNRVLGYAEVARGGVGYALFTASDVFRVAIHVGAAAVILVHNHPSGDPTPSEADKAVTERVRKAGELLGIQVLDHIIVTDDPESYASFADLGLLRSE